LKAVENWREGLDEGLRRRLNHPSAVLAHWRRATTPRPARTSDVAAVLRQFVAAVREVTPENADVPVEKAQTAAEWLQRYLGRIRATPSALGRPHSE
jgi:hypothetical protein